MIVRIIIVFALLVIGNIAMAQTTRDVAPPTPPKPLYQSEKSEKSNFIQRLFEKKEARDEEVAEFRRRMKKVARKKRKEERLAQKPQYSDPLYFGHKKPPKKRKNGKKKFCKECGLVH